MGTYFTRLARGLSNYKWLLALNIFLISPILIHDVKVLDGLSGLRDPVVLFNLTISGLLLISFQLLFKRPWKFHLIIFPLYIVVAAELFLIWKFDARLTTSYIAIVLNETEHAVEFLVNFLPELVGGSTLFLLLYGLLMIKSRGATHALDRRLALLPLTLFLLTYAATIVRQMKVIPAEFELALMDVLAHDKNSPFGVLSQGVLAYQLNLQAQRNYALRRDFRFGATRPGAPTSPELHVLVIGESSRPDHWGINGYARNTTPRLAQTERLVSFTDAIAEVALTRLSVPLLLTRANVANRANFAAERSIVSAYREVGFETYWLSTQQWDAFTSEVNHYASEAQHLRYFERRHDAVLLEQLDNVIATHQEPDAKIFVVLHTLGSHMDYSKRYPDEFILFPQNLAGSHKEWLVDTYDNSIYYTDYFLSELIARLERFQGPSSLLYTSDHGENLMDDERGLKSHFQNNEYDLPIALLFWASQRYDAIFPSKLSAGRIHANAPISTANIFDTLLDIAGIELPNHSHARGSVLGNELVATPRLVQATGDSIRDYDETPRHAIVLVQSATTVQSRRDDVHPTGAKLEQTNEAKAR